MRLPPRGSRETWVMSLLWRVFAWILVLTVAVCALLGWGPAGSGALVRLGAIAFAALLVFILIRMEMLFRDAARAGKAGADAERHGEPPTA